MKPFSVLFKSLLFSLLLAGSVLAADKVDINTADAAQLEDGIVAMLTGYLAPRARSARQAQ